MLLISIDVDLWIKLLEWKICWIKKWKKCAKTYCKDKGGNMLGANKWRLYDIFHKIKIDTNSMSVVCVEVSVCL